MLNNWLTDLCHIKLSSFNDYDNSKCLLATDVQTISRNFSQILDSF